MNHTAFRKIRALAFLAPLGLCACGSGGGGTISTPPPETSTATYTSVNDLTKNDFELKTISLLERTDGHVLSRFGEDVTIKFQKSSGTYTLTSPAGGVFGTFGPGQMQSPGSWSRTDGTTSQSLEFYTSSQLLLTYTMIGSWRITDPGKPDAYRVLIAGSPTIRTDMPTGSASYNLRVKGFGGNSVSYSLEPKSTGTLTANFAAGTLTTTLDLTGSGDPGGATVELGHFFGSGSIASGGPAFSGTLDGTNGTGAFAGAFFGPKALEAAYAFDITGSGFKAYGEAFGSKGQ